jgi:uncharacterized phage protein gp47/JayE
MPSQADISSAIQQALAVSEPDLDTSVGSVTRKIIDAVASQISDASLDTQLLTYQYDIYSMTGAALDAFVQLFGLSRFPAARATGTVSFTRPTATDVISVPISAQVSTPDGSVVVQTLAAAILDVGALTVSVPVQAVTSGPAGNVSPGTLTQVLTPLAEISAVTNAMALTGGANQETDTQLQARWVATVFRNMAGTGQMFLGTALNVPGCTAANVVGPTTRRREQVQIEAGSAASTVNDAQYVYPSGQVVGRDIDAGDIAAPGLQYTWNYSVIPPTITVLDSSYFPNGEVVDLSFLYLDDASRNEPNSGILNRVDVWCAGTVAVPASQSVIYRNLLSFAASPTSNYYSGDFVRADGTTPTTGNIFLPLAFGPIVTMDATIVIGATTYGLATAANPLGSTAGGIQYAYQIVHRTGPFGWSPYSDFGLEWVASMQPPANSAFSIGSDYTYNSVPSVAQSDLENWALAATDIQAHQANELVLQFSLAIIYDPSVTPSVTQAAIGTALSNYLSQLGFNAWIYPSSVIQTVENTPGVTAARFIVGSDIPGYNGSTPDAYNVGIQQLAGSTVVNSFVDLQGNPVNVQTEDDTVASFGAVQLITKAGNTFGPFS